MEIYFKIISLLKRIFNNRIMVSGVRSRKVYKVEIKIRYNTIDYEIVHRRYHVVGLSEYKNLTSYRKSDEEKDINRICNDIKYIIELDSGVEIDISKMKKAITSSYTGKLEIDDIIIKMTHV